MAESKLKLLRIIDILKETDEQSSLTAPEICIKLELYGISAERKSVCRDINLLIDSGYKINLCNDKRNGYYMSSHEFSDWEIKILMDAIWQAKCITYDDSKIVCDKLLAQSSERGRKILKRIISVENKNKSQDFYAKDYIKTLIEAMYMERKVSFQYTDRDKNMKRILRYEGYLYKVNPYTIVWQNDTYYLICNIDKYDNLTNFRLDRMEDLKICSDEITRDPKEVLGVNPSVRIQEYVNTSVNHYGGELIRLKLECEEADMNVLYDFTGGNVRVSDQGNGKLLVSFEIQNSDGLINWLMQCGKIYKVVEPVEIKEKLIRRLKETIEKYE
ncbi:MAG: helix-turn-helix transcriptional regulator [Mobilitalea sp.]